MHVALLYVDGCPNWQQTLADVTTVLKEYQVSTEVELIKVTSNEEAERLAFLGSPTILVDGADIDPDALDSEYSLEQRAYWVEDTPQERPPREWIAAAIDAALEK